MRAGESIVQLPPANVTLVSDKGFKEQCGAADLARRVGSGARRQGVADAPYDSCRAHPQGARRRCAVLQRLVASHLWGCVSYLLFC